MKPGIEEAPITLPDLSQEEEKHPDEPIDNADKKPDAGPPDYTIPGRPQP